MDVKDSNGTLLAEGDSVTLIKDLKVKGSSQTLKRGTLVKNIRLTNLPAEMEGRAGGSTMVLKTEFLKKAWPPDGARENRVWYRLLRGIAGGFRRVVFWVAAVVSARLSHGILGGYCHRDGRHYHHAGGVAGAALAARAA